MNVVRRDVVGFMHFFECMFNVHATFAPRCRVDFDHGFQITEVVSHRGGVRGLR